MLVHSSQVLWVHPHRILGSALHHSVGCSLAPCEPFSAPSLPPNPCRAQSTTGTFLYVLRCDVASPARRMFTLHRTRAFTRLNSGSRTGSRQFEQQLAQTCAIVQSAGRFPAWLLATSNSAVGVNLYPGRSSLISALVHFSADQAWAPQPGPLRPHAPVVDFRPGWLFRCPSSIHIFIRRLFHVAFKNIRGT